jgi:hypothetical protein
MNIMGRHVLRLMGIGAFAIAIHNWRRRSILKMVLHSS